jgi:metal-responsive CopG/Arc/MetJ family transcriptional regulator
MENKQGFLTCRIDEKLLQTYADMARRKNITRSVLIRDALKSYLPKLEESGRETKPNDDQKR